MSVPVVILGRVEAGNPAWVPGEVELEARERLLRGTTGLYGALSPGVGPLLEVAAQLVAHAFAAYAEGDWEACDGLITEGRHACGEVFTAFVEHIASPGWPCRVDSPFWDDFIARLAVAVLRPEIAVAPAPPPRQVESEADFLKRLSRIRAEAEARQAASSMTQSEADELRAMGLM